MQIQPNCPICNHQSDQIAAWGGCANHVFDKIAGIKLAQAAQPFSLYKCPNCFFVYKLPRLSDTELLEIYAESTDRAGVILDSNLSPSDDGRLSLLAQLSENVASSYTSGRKVLEVGCSNGGMLRLWSSFWDKYGVEPSQASAKIARNRGIKVIAKSVSEIPSGMWDCIITVDVAEHLYNPLEFFKQAKSLLAPGGVVVTMTGNISFWLANLAGARYWYASFPEHISFLSPACLRYIASSLNGRILDSKSYQWGRPGKHDLKQHALQSVKYGIIFIGLSASMLGCGNQPAIKRGFPVMTAHQDHFLNVMGGFD